MHVKKDQGGDVVWGQTHPILIPCFDQDGEVIAIRPHKGGMPGERSRLFLATFAAEVPPPNGTPGIDRKYGPGHCVVTMGEFKACAVYWAFAGEVGTAAIPGISQSKNFTVFEELKEWLQHDCVVEKLVAAFEVFVLC